MLEILGIFAYLTIGFGTGGIVFRNHHKKAIDEEFNNFQKESENEITQHKANKIKYSDKVLELTKNNGELKKLNIRGERNIEILNAELVQMQSMIEQLQSKKKEVPEKIETNIDNYFD